MKPIQALCFDLDHTLLEGGNADAVRYTCDVLATESGLDAARVLEANMTVWPAYFPEVEDRWVRGQLETGELGLEAWRRTLRACGCDDQALAVLARDTHYDQQCASFRLYEDVLACFERLPTGLPLAMITNGASDLQREKIRRLDIESWFDVIVISGELGSPKPEPAVFLAVLHALNLGQTDSVWHVGDNLPADVGGARSAGLTAVWLNREGAPRQSDGPAPHHEIASLTELPALIATL